MTCLSRPTLAAQLVWAGALAIAVASAARAQGAAPAPAGSPADAPAVRAEPAPALTNTRSGGTADARAGSGAQGRAGDSRATLRLREDVPIDPMDRLRERLSMRLGSRPVGGPLSGGTLKVVARATDDPAPPALPPPRRAPRAAAPIPWAYEGAGGPDAWARLKPEYATCAKGSRQSPIDLQGGIRVQLDPIAFDYKPAPYRVIDNGHTIEVEVPPGSAIEVLGRRYELQQFHFHLPSEARVDGRRFDMEVHLVHRDAEGRVAVVAVLLERGAAQAVVQAVWNHLPLEKGDAVSVRAPLDPSALLPDERGYYTYMGSLTTPPCSENVLWMVMKKPVGVSAEQLGIFARLYPMNARPVQASSGRLVKESE
jgi:carbonic anhydrase